MRIQILLSIRGTSLSMPAQQCRSNQLLTQPALDNTIAMPAGIICLKLNMRPTLMLRLCLH